MNLHPRLALLVVGALALSAATAAAQPGSPAARSDAQGGRPAVHAPAPPPDPDDALIGDLLGGPDELAFAGGPGPEGPPPGLWSADDGEDGGDAIDAPSPAGGPGPMGRGGMRGAWEGMRRGPGPHGMGPMGPGGGLPHGALLQRLHLSDAQRSRLADIRERQARRDITGRADLQLARMDLGKLLRSEKPDAAAINAQIDRLAALRATQAKARVASHLEARAVLTSEQLGELRTLREQWPGGPGNDPAGKPSGGAQGEGHSQ